MNNDILKLSIDQCVSTAWHQFDVNESQKEPLYTSNKEFLQRVYVI